MKITHRFNTKGQGLVEFALIIPIFLLIVMMIFDAGRAIYYYSVVHNAAREGARYGIILTHDNEADIIDAALQLTAGLGCSNIDVSVTRNYTEPCGAGCTVLVEVSCDFIPVTPLIGNFFPSGTLTLLGRSEMAIEG
jgi:Flp pilus assembly protein TadG